MPPATPLSVALVVSVCLWAGPASAEPAPEPAVLGAALLEFNGTARFPLPALTDAQLERLASGRLVKVRERGEDPDAPQRVIGLLHTRADPSALWLSQRDAHFGSVDEVVEVQLNPGEWPAVWYQHLDLPRPFSDRHWVVDVSPNIALSRATGGRCWEQWWVLTDGGPAVAADVVGAGRIPGITSALIEDAIYVPVNHGAWITIALPGGGAILGYHVTSVIGGRIPDSLVADYAALTLGKMMRGVIDRVPEVLEHYDADHAPIEGGDGVPIPPTGRSARSE